jgi:O-6-methylguanine DNA methyltransferase
MLTFKQKVFAVVKKIPKGKVLTYIEVARRAGHPLASQAVGNALHTNYDKSIPCHRVVRSDGYIGGYNRGAKMKRAILKKEGVKIKGDYIQ